IISKGHLPLGLDFEHVQPLAFDFASHSNLIAVADRFDRVEQLRNMLVQSMSLVKGSHKLMLIDSSNQSLVQYSDEVDTYVSDIAAYSMLKKQLLSDIEYRINHKTHDPKWIVMISDFKEFVAQSLIDIDELNTLWNASRLG